MYAVVGVFSGFVRLLHQQLTIINVFVQAVVLLTGLLAGYSQNLRFNTNNAIKSPDGTMQKQPVNPSSL